MTAGIAVELNPAAIITALAALVVAVAGARGCLAVSRKRRRRRDR